MVLPWGGPSARAGLQAGPHPSPLPSRAPRPFPQTPKNSPAFLPGRSFLFRATSYSPSRTGPWPVIRMGTAVSPPLLLTPDSLLCAQNGFSPVAQAFSLWWDSPMACHCAQKPVAQAFLPVSQTCFNPPARAGRDDQPPPDARLLRLFQSTRPARGATCGEIRYTAGFLFQSTRPARGATTAPEPMNTRMKFQSTRPARGATCAGLGCPARLVVSIHAPRAGRDRRGGRQDPGHGMFQSTRPARGATPVRFAQARARLVSIHAPRAGRDAQPKGQTREEKVSIHAPRAGRDASLRAKQLEDFMFQSTRPARGATRGVGLVQHQQLVSIHAPRAGRDAGRGRGRTSARSFNPRAPRGARRGLRGHYVGAGPFQSTRPARGATGS